MKGERKEREGGEEMARGKRERNQKGQKSETTRKFH